MTGSNETDRGKLGNFLREVIDWDWQQFCDAEKDEAYSGYQSSVFALVRSAAEQKLQAIKLSIARIDGQVKTPIKVEYPTAYLLFPYAEKLALPPPNHQAVALLPDPEPTSLKEIEEGFPEMEEPQDSLATLTLRETLDKMADAPRNIPLLIDDQRKRVEKGAYLGDAKVPLVKSVICAHLLILANEKHNFDAITEIFDQIDGKLVGTIKLMGDIYRTSYALEAPYNAVKNKDGIYQIEQQIVTDLWTQKLSNKRN